MERTREERSLLPLWGQEVGGEQGGCHPLTCCIPAGHPHRLLLSLQLHPQGFWGGPEKPTWLSGGARLWRAATGAARLPCTDPVRAPCPASPRGLCTRLPQRREQREFSPAKPQPLRPLPRERRWLLHLLFNLFLQGRREGESHPNLAKCQGVIQRRGERQREAAHTGELFLISKCQHVL